MKVIIATLAIICQVAALRTFCYFESGAAFREGLGKFTIRDIDPKFCTHLIYSSVGIDFENQTLKSPNLEVYFKSLMSLRQWNSEMKILFSLDVNEEKTYGLDNLKTSSWVENNLVQTIWQFIHKNGFDGVDVRLRVSQQGEIFSRFLQNLRSKLIGSKILSCAVTFDVRDSYDIPVMNKVCDFFNIMAFDYHSAEDGYLGYNSPLSRGPTDDIDYLILRHVDYSIWLWSSVVTDKKKINLGISTIGKTYLKSNEDENDVGSLSKGKGSAGMFTKTEGILSYYEICDRIKSDNYEIMFDTIQKVPFAFNSTEWISYDDLESVKLKVKFALKQKIKGFAIYTISDDDFLGMCGRLGFPVLKTVYDLQ